MPPQQVPKSFIPDEPSSPTGPRSFQADAPTGGGRGSGAGPRTGQGGGRAAGQQDPNRVPTAPPLGQLASDLAVGAGKGLGRAVIDLAGMLVSQPSGGQFRTPEFDPSAWEILHPSNATQEFGGVFGEAVPSILPGAALARQANAATRASGGLLRSAIPELTEAGAEFLGSRGIGRITATNRAKTLDILRGQKAANVALAEGQTANLQAQANKRHAEQVQRLKDAHATQVAKAAEEAAAASPRSAQEIMGTSWPPEWSGGPPSPPVRLTPRLPKPTLPPAPTVTPVEPAPVDWNPATGMREAMERRTSTMGRLASLGSTLAATGGAGYLWNDNPMLAMALLGGRQVATPGARATLAHGLRRFAPAADTIGGATAGLGVDTIQDALLKALGIGDK